MRHAQILFAGSALFFGTALPASPAAAVTGPNGNLTSPSLCSESGISNPDEDTELERIFGDPGGLVQSFGYSLGWGGIQDPENFDPRTGRGTPMPGFYCNPIRFDFAEPE